MQHARSKCRTQLAGLSFDEILDLVVEVLFFFFFCRNSSDRLAVANFGEKETRVYTGGNTKTLAESFTNLHQQ